MNSKIPISALYPVISRVRCDISAVKSSAGIFWKRDEPLTEERLEEHLNGGVARGVCPIKEGESITKLALLDFDSHKGETSWETMVQVAKVVATELERRGMKPILFRSSGGRGIHLFLLWDTSQDAYSLRRFLMESIGAVGFANGTEGVAKKQIEIFPKQDNVPIGGCGHQFILPLAGQSVPLDPANNFQPMPREAITTLAWPISTPVPISERPTRAQLNARNNPEDADIEYYREPLTSINPDCDRKIWLDIGMALHHQDRGGVDGLLLWDEWSSGALWKDGTEGVSNYEGLSDLEYQWEHFRIDRLNPVTGRTIEKYARDAGWTGISAENEFGDFNMSDKTTERFKLFSADDYANGPETECIIDGVLPETGIAMIVGASGSSKTFIVIDLVASVALNRNWRGLEVKQKRVVFIAAEGAAGLRKRIRAYQHQHGVKFGDNLQIIDDAPNFLTADHVELANCIKRHGGAQVIVIDTLAQTTPGGDENGSADMGKALNSCKMLQQATGALIILVHHYGKNIAKGARGWSGLKGALDTEIEVIKKGDERYAKITKQKDGEEGQIFPFRLQPISLGFNAKGKEITSCIVQHIDTPLKSKIMKPVGAWQKAIYTAVEALTSFGRTHHTTEQIIDEAVKNVARDPNEKRDRRRDKLKKALNSMIGKSLQSDGDLICLPQYHKTPQTDNYGDMAKSSETPQTPHDSKGVWRYGRDAASGYNQDIIENII